MNNSTITFLALSSSIDFQIMSDEIFNDFAMIFAKDADCEDDIITLEALQQNTQEFRNKVDSVVQKYKAIDPKIQKFNSYFKDLDDNEHFYFFPNTNLSEEQIFYLSNHLSALNSNEDFEKLANQIDDLFGVIRDNYQIVVFNEKTRHKIGESDKSKRICRFCNKGADEAEFKKKAHSISEALGNKKIITNDECDVCNEKFGSGIERDLILYLNLYRNFFGVKGKKGIPKFKGKNFEIENNGIIEIRHYLTDEEINDPKRDSSNFNLETNQEIITQNIYRTLCKYALSVIDKSYLANFQDTIRWINNEISYERLPVLAILASYNLFAHHPRLSVYIRKTENLDLPYAVAEFRFTFLTFVFIIPKSIKDKLEFIEPVDFDRFWTFFKIYSSVPNWTFRSMDDSVARGFRMNINFKPKQKE